MVAASTAQVPPVSPVTIDDQVQATRVAIYLGGVARGPAGTGEVYWRIEFDSKFL